MFLDKRREMLTLIARYLLRRKSRLLLLILGLAVLGASVLLIADASRTTTLVVDQNLGHYWRTTYDILVRPAGTRSPIESRFGLVEANYLSGINGGISIAQYNTIESIPGVAVAAPIAMIGYTGEAVPAAELSPDLKQYGDGVYRLLTEVVTDAGYRKFRNYSVEDYYIGPPKSLVCPQGYDLQECPVYFSDTAPVPFAVAARFYMPFLVAGVDPLQEADLVRLDESLLQGNYLTGDEPIDVRRHPDLLPLPEMSGLVDYSIPVLINATPYVSLTVQAELDRLFLPSPVPALPDIMRRGGKRYLDTMPGKRLTGTVVGSREAYSHLVGSLLRHNAADGNLSRSTSFGTLHSFMDSMPAPLRYRVSQAPSSYRGLVLELVLPPEGHVSSWGLLGDKYTAFRQSRPRNFAAKSKVVYRGEGVFDISAIPRPADVNRVPLETYFPPVATLRYDEVGHPVTPITLRPTLDPTGYIQPPPLILTTLKAAEALRGDRCISAVRVRVGGIDRLTPIAQRKIETVASEIVRRTGLDVDIMVGSSPTKVLVRVPTVGYVEEQWIKKNVTYRYAQRVQAGHVALLVCLMIIGGLFVLDLGWAEVTSRRRYIALQKALGWRSGTIFGQLLVHMVLCGLLAAGLGVGGAWTGIALLGWSPPSPDMVLTIAAAIIGLSAVGALYPAWAATRTPPVVGMRRDSGTSRAGRRMPVGRLISYAGWGLTRRRASTVLTGLMMLFSSALLVFMLSVTLDRHGQLSGTLLGTFILVQIRTYHYAIAVIAFGLAGLGIAESLLTAVFQRRREIGVLKAVGWRTGTVIRLFVFEGLILGLAGGVMGALVGLCAFLVGFGTASTHLIWVISLGLGMTTAVGVLAALYPAKVAAGVPPAEAVRYE